MKKPISFFFIRGFEGRWIKLRKHLKRQNKSKIQESFQISNNQTKHSQVILEWNQRNREWNHNNQIKTTSQTMQDDHMNQKIEKPDDY